MKKITLCSLVAVFLVLLTSCLGDGNNSQTMSFGTVGVVTTSSKTGQVIVNTATYGPIYNEDIAKSFVPGDCIQLNCSYDSSNPNNANDYTNGYIYVTLTTEPALVDKGRLMMTVSDTTKLLDPNEFALENVGTEGGSFALADGYIFMSSSYQGLTKQENEWQLYYDMNQKPVDQSGTNLYTFELRAIKVADGKSPKGIQNDLNAYQTKSLLNQLNTTEYSAGKSQFFIRFRYLKKINEDGSLVWEYSKSATINTAKP